MGSGTKHPMTDGWWWEVIAACFSFLSLATILILLVHYDGSTTVSWGHVSLNAVVSIFATLSRILLIVAISGSLGQWRWNWFSKEARPLRHFEVLESASRGSWGSFRLLWLTKSCSLVAVGAWITILAVAFDPFVQQIINYRTQLTFSQNSNARIALSQRWLGGSNGEPTVVYGSNGGYTFEYVQPQLDFASQAAVLTGLSTKRKALTQQTPFTCSTGNCEWEQFYSLAMCSQCNDVSDQITTTIVYGSTEYEQAVASANDPASRYDCRKNLTTHSLPNGVHIDNPDLFLGEIPHPCNAFPPILMSSRNTARRSETVTFGDTTTLIFGISILRVHYASQTPWSWWPDVNVTAADCALYLCVKSYESRVINGTLTEASHEVPWTRTPDSWQDMQPHDGIKTSKKLQNDSLYVPDQWVLRSDLQLKVSSPQMLGGNITSFDIPQVTIDSIIAYLNSTFTDDSVLLRTNGTVTGVVVSNQDEVSFGSATPAVLEMLWNSDDLAGTFENLAVSISSAMRANNSNPRYLNGQLGKYETVVQVRWEWISLPSFCVICGALFLAITILATRNYGLPLWRNNVLAVLFHGLEEKTLGQMHEPVLCSDMEHTADSVGVVLNGYLTLCKHSIRPSETTQADINSAREQIRYRKGSYVSPSARFDDNQ